MPYRRFALAVVFVLLASRSYGYRMSTWIPAWDGAALTSIQANAGKLDETNPVWYSMNPDGSIAKNWNAENASLRAAMTGTRVLPTFQNIVGGSFNGDVAATLLSTDASRSAHAEAIVALAVLNAYDGVDIDYERVPATSKDSFTAFLQLLASKLHGAGKKLSVTVYAKTSGAITRNGPGAEDWSQIGAIADLVKIMAYDYHWSTSEPGAIAPLSWLDQVATYAEATIPSSKIIIGLPWYGYDWQGGVGRSVVYTQAMALAAQNAAPIQHDADGEAYFTYADHTVWFQDATSFSRKLQALTQRHPGIAGFAQWRAGGEDASFWTSMQSLGSSSTGGGGATPVSGDFAIGGATLLNAKSGRIVSSSYSITPINGFSGNVSVTADKLSAFAGTVSLSSASLSPNGAITLTVSLGSVASGAYQLRLRFTNGSVAHDEMISLNVSGSRQRDVRRR